MARVSVSYDDRRLRNNIRRFPDDLRRGIAATVDYGAARAEGYVKTQAPWTDNTGAARSGLFAIPTHFKTSHEILIAYSVTYGIWLEVANSGRYAIITPAMRIQGAMLMADLQSLLDRL